MSEPRTREISVTFDLDYLIELAIAQARALPSFSTGRLHAEPETDVNGEVTGVRISTLSEPK